MTEQQRIAAAAPQLTHSGCKCLPVTYNIASTEEKTDREKITEREKQTEIKRDTVVQVWTGCGSQGWCDVEPGCEQAQEADISENYHGVPPRVWLCCRSPSPTPHTTHHFVLSVESTFHIFEYVGRSRLGLLQLLGWSLMCVAPVMQLRLFRFNSLRYLWHPSPRGLATR